MKKLLVNVGIRLGSSAVALILAALILPRFTLGVGGLLTAVVVFTVAQSLLVGLVARLATKYVPTLAGAASLVPTWLALVLASMAFGGIRIHGFFTWILAALVIWAVTGICAVVAPRLIEKSSSQ